MSSEVVSARCGVDVVAGVLPGMPEPEFTRRWVITSEQWHAEGADQLKLLSDLAGVASAYATNLMLKPERLNWVQLVWVWLF